MITLRGVRNVSYSINKTLKHKPQLFYHVVSDVSSYSEFLPYCTDSFINQRDPHTDLPTEAGLRVGFKSFDEEFTCELECEPLEKTIVAKSITHSLFKHLYTKWTILPVPGEENKCQMELLLKYEFKSALYNSVSGYFAESVSKLVIHAFDKRAFKLNRKLSR